MPTFTPTAQISQAIEAAGVDLRDALAEQYAEALVYLLDSAGAEFGYRYEWDPFGPRSPELAEDIADMTPADLEQTSVLDEPAAQAAERVRSLVTEPVTEISVGRWVQLLAAVDYLQSVAKLQLTNGDRPPYIERSFGESTVEAAKEKVGSLHGH